MAVQIATDHRQCKLFISKPQVLVGSEPWSDTKKQVEYTTTIFILWSFKAVVMFSLAVNCGNAPLSSIY